MKPDYADLFAAGSTRLDPADAARLRVYSEVSVDTQRHERGTAVAARKGGWMPGWPRRIGSGVGGDHTNQNGIHGPTAAILTTAPLALESLAVGAALVATAGLLHPLPGPDGDAVANRYTLVAVLALFSWVATMWRRRGVSAMSTVNRLDEVVEVFRTQLRVVSTVVVAAFLLRLDISRSWLALSGALTIVSVLAEREVVRRHVARLRRKGHLLQRVLFVGGNAEARDMCAMLAEDPEIGFTPVGFVDDDRAKGSHVLDGYRVLGRLDEAKQVAVHARASALVIATTAIGQDATIRLIHQLGTTGLQLKLSSSLRDISPGRLRLEPLGRCPVLHVEGLRRDGWESSVKRALDLVGAVLLGVLAAPLLGFAALMIKITSRGPVHFRQQRVGKDGKPFEMLKLRTMVVDAEAMLGTVLSKNEAAGPIFKLKGDPRITPVGRLLRAWSIDELPQLWNVLRGEMSLVGPRPALAKEMASWSHDLYGRLVMRPGMTGLWQVSGRGRWRSFEQYARCDLYYVNNWSLWTDLAILAKTVPAVLLGRGES